MTSYRLVVTKDEKIVRIMLWGFTISFLLPIPFLFFFVQDRSTALGLSIFLSVISAIFLLAVMISYNYYGKYVTLEDDTMKVYTPKGREIGVYSLKKMNKSHCVICYGGKGGGCSRALLLYEQGLHLKGGYWISKEGYILYVNFYQHSWDEKKRMVVIKNKALEEKILAYYDEKPIEDQE